MPARKWRLLLGFLALVALGPVAILRLPQFGAAPAGERRARLHGSANFENGRFVNQRAGPSWSKGYSVWGLIHDMLFVPPPRPAPSGLLPSGKSDLGALEEDGLIWFGHSSFYLQLGGVRMLVDPVLSGYASPFSWSTRAFPGTDVYAVEELPDIDVLLISHDHYDHLDYQTVTRLRERTRKVVCGLGVGAHLEEWGWPAEKIVELDWGENISFGGGVTTIHVEPARHGSGRGLRQDQTLWVSFVIESAGRKIFYGGDSGYDAHFADIGKRHGPFELAILENGQYAQGYELHSMPAETLRATKDLRAARLFPVHNSKFALGNHDWDKPLEELSTLNDAARGPPLVTPKIGEVVRLADPLQTFERWWRDAPR